MPVTVKPTTFVGLDVHAQKTVAAALDGGSGEVVMRQFAGTNEEIAAWVAEAKRAKGGHLLHHQGLVFGPGLDVPESAAELAADVAATEPAIPAPPAEPAR